MGLITRRRERKEKDTQLFNQAISKIYGDAKLSNQTLRQLKQTWKNNPELIKNTYRQKIKTYGSDEIGEVNQEGINWADLGGGVSFSYKNGGNINKFQQGRYE